MGEDDQLDIGSIAVAYGLITPEALKDCREDLRLMHERGVRLSLAEVLLSKELLDREALARVRKLGQALAGEKSKLGHFELLEKLGEGGMGTVYKVRDVRSGQIAALKILPVTYAGNREFVQRFKGEARVLTSLSHPNIVKALDFGQLDYGSARLHYIAMEFVEGESLMQRIEREGAVHERRAIEWLTDIARALQHAHHSGLIHRDVKPDNIFITKDGYAKLGDFGLAVDVAEEATRITRTGIFMGSVHYASPEQAESLKDVDVRSDIYSLGATFYHALTGQVPFEGGSAPEILVMHLTEELPWPGDVNPRVSDAASELVAKMMAKKKEERFQNPMELLRALEELKAQRKARPLLRSSAESSIARSTDGRRRVLREHRKRRERATGRPPSAGAEAPAAVLDPRILAGVAAAAVLLGTVAGLLLLGGGQKKPPTRREVLAPRLPGLPTPEEEAGLAPTPEAESEARGLFPRPSRAAEEPAAEGSALLAGFERNVCRLACGPAADAELTAELAARGRGALKLVKLEGLAAGGDAFVEVDFPKPVDLSDHDRLGLWLRSSGPENEFRLALITAGKEAFIPPAKDPVLGAEWTWAEFVLAGHRESAEGFVIYFNRRGLAVAFDVYLDELRAYGRAEPVLLAEKVDEPAAVPEPAPARPVAAVPEKATQTAERKERKGTGEILFAHDFEDGPGPFRDGEITTTNTFRSSRASYRATPDLKRQYNSCRTYFDRWTAEKRNEAGVFRLGQATVVAFAYYLDGTDVVRLQGFVSAKKENFQTTLTELHQREWRVAQLSLLDLRPNTPGSTAKVETGDWFDGLSWFAGKQGVECTFVIDDVVIRDGPFPGDLKKVLGLFLDRRREKNADPKKDGFHITTEMLDELARRFGDGGAAKRGVALLGDRLAGSSYFLAPLFRPGGSLEGRRLIPKAALVKRTGRLSGYRRRDALVKALKKYRPQVVAVLAGFNDLRAGLSADEAATEYGYICECCTEAGAVPVLFTIPVRAASQLSGLARAYNDAVFKAAGHFGVPVVDAYSWLNAKGKDARRRFSPTGLRKAAYDELNGLFAKVHGRLDKYVFKRAQ